MKKLSKILLISLMAVFLAAGSANAKAYLSVFDGTNTYSIGDSDPSDTASTVGIVSFSGSLGSWNYDLTGTSKDVIGGLTSPEMDFNAVVTGGTGTDPFTAVFSETYFEGAGEIPYLMDFDGTAGDTVKWQMYWDPANQPFATTIPLASIGPLGPGNYSGGAQGKIDFSGDNDVPFYSLTMVGEFTPGSPVPEPATMLLLGSGLVGLAGIRRKFKK